MQAPPLTELYDLLRTEGFSIGVDDHIRICRLIERDASWNREMLRGAIASLVVTEPHERDAFDSCWERWMRSVGPACSEESERPVYRTAKASTARRVRVIRGAVILAIAVFVAVILSARYLENVELRSSEGSAQIPEGTNGSDTPKAIAGANLPSSSAGSSGVRRVSKDTGSEKRIRDDIDIVGVPPDGDSEEPEIQLPDTADAVNEPPPTQLQFRRTWSIAVTLVSGALGIFVLIIAACTNALRARARRRFLPGPWRFVLAVPEASKPVLSRRAIEDAAADLAWQATEADQELDLKRSIAATVDSGGLPTLVHCRPVAAPRYVVLEDTAGGAACWRFVYDELFRNLALERVQMERYTFWANPQYCFDPRGTAALLDELLNDADALIVVGDGNAAINPLDGSRAGWLASLRQISRRLWINPLPPSRWGSGADAIAVDTPMIHGAAHAFAALDRDVDRCTAHARPYPGAIQRVPGSVSAIAALGIALGERAFRLVAAVAVAGPPTIEAARWLAEALALELDEQDWLAVATLPWFPQGEWPAGLREGLRRRLETDDPGLARSVAMIADRLLSASEPERNSAAHAAWQLEGAYRSWHRGERAAATRSLNQIAGTSLAHEAQGLLATFGLPDSERRARIWAVVLGVALVVGAASAGVVPTCSPSSAVTAFSELETRPYEIRLAYPDATAYRPERSAMLGANDAIGERIPYAALDAFQKKRDGHAVAIAGMWNGAKLTDVAEQLRTLEQKPAVRADRAAVESLTTSGGNLEHVLAELEILRGDRDVAVARAARWNHALLLSRLDLPFSAAQEFAAIAAEGEHGWSDEARERTTKQQAFGVDARKQWGNAATAGQRMVTTGEPVDPKTVDRFPGVTRAYFYNAVRTAPSRERVLALLPIAEQLDRVGGTSTLTDYVQRVARGDFHKRAPLAAVYAELLNGKAPEAPLLAQLTTNAAAPEVVDIVMGAMVELDAIPDHLDAFRTMTRATGDPWFEIVLANAAATAALQRRDWLGAEALLRDAEKRCTPAVLYQCLARALSLGRLYQDLHQVTQAIEVLDKAVRAARSAGEWGKYVVLLRRLADVERFHSSTATARAYAGDVLLLADKDCAAARPAYNVLTGAALLDVNGPAARRYFKESQRCGVPDLHTANYLTDIGRLDPDPGDLAQLQGWLTALRANGKLTPADRALADEIEGRLLIEGDRSAGTALLERAIAAAGAAPRDVVAEKARAGAYSVLTFDAARHDDATRTMTLIADALGLPAPGPCTVGMIAEDERSAVVVRGGDGKDRLAFERKRAPRSGAPVIADALVQTLAGCPQVRVMAEAGLQGQPGVLPPSMAWSYVTGARPPTPDHEAAPVGTSALIVTDVRPPASLDLVPLGGRVQASPTSTVLSGPMATPSKVLAAMTHASEVQFRKHALVDMGVSGASHLVLSPDPDGQYALTADAIRSAELRGRPIVVLAACESAVGARYRHAPWSLPHAFLAAGARAVFAAATKIPDQDSGAFFARVLAKMRNGAVPATALRDERAAVLAVEPTSWVANVILFE